MTSYIYMSWCQLWQVTFTCHDVSYDKLHLYVMMSAMTVTFICHDVSYDKLHLYDMMLAMTSYIYMTWCQLWQVTFIWHDVSFELDQQISLIFIVLVHWNQKSAGMNVALFRHIIWLCAFYSSSSLKQKSAGRNIAPFWHIDSEPTSLCSYPLAEKYWIWNCPLH